MKKLRKRIETINRVLGKPWMLILTGVLLLSPAALYLLVFTGDHTADALVPIQTRWGLQITTGGGLCLTLGLLGLFYVVGGIRRLGQRPAKDA